MTEKITTKDKGYLIERPGLRNHPWVLGVQGSPFEMGYQQGFLLAEHIRSTASGFLSPIFAQFGGWQPGSESSPTMEQMSFGRAVLYDAFQKFFEPALIDQAPDLYEEMKGLVAGINAAGVEIPKEDIFIGNCIPEITELQFYLPDESENQDKNQVEAKGCSDCITWGNATTDGQLIHGTNYDYATFNVLHKGIGIVVARPDDGHPFLAQCLAGTVGFYRGMNTEGVTVGEPTSESSDRNIKQNPRIPHAMHMRKLMQFTTNLEDAVETMTRFMGTTGFNHSIGDNKIPSALSIEASCTQMTVVRPQSERDALSITNHFVGYPGFNGYDGHNMVKGQLEFWGIPWENADTPDKWQLAARKETDKRTFSCQRYDVLEKLITEQYGSIDVDQMIRFMSTWPLTRDPQDLGQLSNTCEQLYGIQAPISDMKLCSIFSAVFDPKNSTAWIAVGAEPAQAGSFWPVNLNAYLSFLDDPATQNNIPRTRAEDGKPGQYGKA